MKAKVLPTENNTSVESQQEDWIKRAQNALMNTYASHPVVLKRGEGSYVEDLNGKKYLDFFAGIAVNSVGHCHPNYIEAVTAQLSQLGHCSNYFLNQPAIELAEELVAESDFDKVFFCNSGTEAIEASLKLCRKYASQTKSKDCTTILTMSNSFHGRTYGSLSATAQTKYHSGYHPLVPRFETVTFNDIDSVNSKDLTNVAAIIVEPVQGEGGIHLADQNFLQQLRSICDQRNIVLVFDEIQCGIGRTGQLFAYQKFGVIPDVVAIAKGLGGGFPIGAALAKEKIAQAFKPGDHGSTFGGNALACTAALTVLRMVRETGFLVRVQKNADLLMRLLLNMKAEIPRIKDVRGVGLILGVELDSAVKPIVQECLENKLLIVSAGENVIRLLPPLTISGTEIEAGTQILRKVLSQKPG